MGSLVKLRDTIRAIGLRDTCLFAASRLAQSIFGTRVRVLKYYFIAQPLDAHPAARRPGAFSLAWVDATSPVFSQIDRP